MIFYLSQVEIDGEMKEDCDHPENYYLRYFKRCQGLLAHINRLSDSVSLLVQAAQPLSIGMQRFMCEIYKRSYITPI